MIVDVVLTGRWTIASWCKLTPFCLIPLVVVLNLLWKMRYFQLTTPWKESLQMGLEALEMFKEVQQPNIHCTRYFAAWKVQGATVIFNSPSGSYMLTSRWCVKKNGGTSDICWSHTQQSSFASWATRSYKYQLCGGPRALPNDDLKKYRRDGFF